MKSPSRANLESTGAKPAVALTERGAQVAPEHYEFESYNDSWRWFSYWHQIRSALRVQPKRVLEIGSGAGVLRGCLGELGIEVLGADIDATRNPDYLVDVADLDESLPPGETFDLVVAAQVLEHLPFSMFERCVRGIAARARPYALITLPYRGWRMSIRFGVDDYSFSLGWRIPKPWPYRFNGQHHWEIGWRHSRRSVEKILRQHFEVLDSHTIKENPYHYLWLLEAKR